MCSSVTQSSNREVSEIESEVASFHLENRMGGVVNTNCRPRVAAGSALCVVSGIPLDLHYVGCVYVGYVYVGCVYVGFVYVGYVYVGCVYVACDVYVGFVYVGFVYVGYVCVGYVYVGFVYVGFVYVGYVYVRQCLAVVHIHSYSWKLPLFSDFSCTPVWLRLC